MLSTGFADNTGQPDQLSSAAGSQTAERVHAGARNHTSLISPAGNNSTIAAGTALNSGIIIACN
jgi:hypothetical protein